MKKSLLVSSILALALSASSAAQYDVDVSHSAVNFQVTHMMISDVDGAFNTFSGVVDFDENTKTLKALSGEVLISSIDTKNDSRDKHLNAPDFFDSAKFPKATLVMKSIKSKKLTADVTIRGITKSVVFDMSIKGPVTNPMSKENKLAIAIKLEGKLNRKDFGIGMDTKDALVSDEIALRIQLEAHSK